MKMHISNNGLYQLFVGLIITHVLFCHLLNYGVALIMNILSTELTQQLRTELAAVETLYRAFSEQNPDALTPTTLCQS